MPTCVRSSAVVYKEFAFDEVDIINYQTSIASG